MGGRSAAMNVWASGARNRRNGESIARGHGGHRGGWDWWGKRCGERPGFRCEKQAKWGEHRTEVTEVTEGDRDWWGKRCGERPGFRGESQARGKHRRGHGGHRRGIGIDGESDAVNVWAFGA
jgi:hypothetical protein